MKWFESKYYQETRIGHVVAGFRVGTVVVYVATFKKEFAGQFETAAEARRAAIKFSREQA